ncbi:MAG: hypothetical protein ACRDH8_08280 [Actinomycetota bacterium]
MALDEGARHRLYGKLEEVLGSEEAGTLMGHLPPAGWADVAVKIDLDNLEHRLSARMESLESRLTARMEQLARRLVMWTSSMVLAAAALAFAAGKFV